MNSDWFLELPHSMQVLKIFLDFSVLLEVEELVYYVAISKPAE